MLCSACIPSSWEGGLKAVGLAPFQVPPHPHPTHPWCLDRATGFPSMSVSLVYRPVTQVYQLRLPSTTPFLAPSDPLALGLSFFLSSRGIVRVTQRRTSPKGKPSTPGGGAVPPNWPGSRWPPGRPGPRRAPFYADSWTPLVASTQAFCIPEHFAREMGMQDSEAFAGEPGDPGSCGCHLLGMQETPAFPKLLILHKMGFRPLPTSEPGMGMWT